MELAESLQLPLIRRYSGGGAVYHDLGNALYSYITPRTLFSRSLFAGRLAEAMREAVPGIKVNGRHDLVRECGDGEVRKVGGSAFRVVRERAYHHGTLLLNTDLSRLKGLLKSPLKIEGASVSSVVSPVTNVPELSLDAFQQLAIQAFARTLEGSPAIDTITIDEEDALGIEEVGRDREELGSWEWTFGKGPEFSVQVGQIRSQVRDGVIVECTEARLVGQRFHPQLLLNIESI